MIASGNSHGNFNFYGDDKDSRYQPIYPRECALSECHQPGLAQTASSPCAINGEPENAWPINMMPVGDGSFYLYLRGDVRKASRTTVGDRVCVEIVFDASYRNGPQHPMPQWFKQALIENPHTMKNWKALAPSRRKEILRYFASLKSPDARARNLSKALHVLSGAMGRFMARTWEKGS